MIGRLFIVAAIGSTALLSSDATAGEASAGWTAQASQPGKVRRNRAKQPERQAKKRERRDTRRDDRRDARQDARRDKRMERNDDPRNPERVERRDARRDDRRDRIQDSRRERRLSAFQNRFDTDGDGRLNIREAKAARERARSYHARLRSGVDRNGDGDISDQEWDAVRSDRSEKRKERRSKRVERREEQRDHVKTNLKAKFDTNGDGKLSRAEREHFRAALQAHRMELLERFDADADGHLSPAERLRLRSSHTARRQRDVERLVESTASDAKE